MYCSKCGKQIKDSAKFCTYCGAKQMRAKKPENEREAEQIPVEQSKEEVEQEPVGLQKETQEQTLVEQSKEEVEREPVGLQKEEWEQMPVEQSKEEVERESVSLQKEEWEQTPVEQPMGEVGQETQRDPIKPFKFWEFVFISFFTCGIYAIIELYRFNKTVNILCKDDGEETPNYVVVILLGIITLNIYTYYWMYKEARRLYLLAPRYGFQIQENGTGVLAWSAFGSFILVGPLVAWNKMFSNINLLIQCYNRGDIEEPYDDSLMPKSSAPIWIVVAYYLCQGIILFSLKDAISMAIFMARLSMDYPKWTWDENYEYEDYEYKDSEDETEAVTERQSETETEAVTERQSETETETEKVTEPATEAAPKLDYKALYDETLSTYQRLYGNETLYVWHDMNNDGVLEMIVSYGTINADWMNDVYTVYNGRSYCAGSFERRVVLYETENKNGIYAVYGMGGYQEVTRLTLSGTKLLEDTVMTGEVGADSYYENDWPIEWKEASEEVTGSVQKPVSEYLIEGSDSRYITEDDIGWMDSETLELAKNEIYARHGRKFVTPRIQEYFNQQSWYHGTVEPEDFSDSVFNKYEMANVLFIVDHE